jgi:hypothetical protein
MDGCDMYVLDNGDVLVQYKVILDNDAKKFDYVVNDDDYLFREAEHRRWMMSMLLMGYRSGPTDERTFTHEDIVPFERLSEENRTKNSYILENAEYIMNG